MSTFTDCGVRRVVASPWFVGGSFVLLTGGMATALSLRAAAVGIACLAWGVVLGARLLAWRNLLAVLIVVILFIPIGRYSLPGNLPFQLEPYRLYVGFLFLIWFGSLLIDPRTRVRRTALGAPLLAVFAIAVTSDLLQPSRIRELGVASVAVKRLTFFASFVLAFFLVVGLIRRARDVHFLVRQIVVGSSILAVLALVEYTTGYNVFNQFSRILPLRSDALPYSFGKGGERLRVFASSQHPIALGALFVMILPLAGYLWHATKQRRWIACGLLLLMGNFTTQSRTAVVMLIVVGLVLLRLRPRAMLQLWPAIIPAVLAIHFAVPGSLGSLTQAFLPKGGVIAQQESGAGTYGSGRLADLGPSLHEYVANPILGEGYGTRVTDRGPLQNARILDDQWLSTLLEMGAAGVVAFLWTFVRLFRRLRTEALTDDSPRGWLCASLAAGVTSFAFGMLTFDAFSFIQVTFILFIFLALAGAVLEIPAADWDVAEGAAMAPRPLARAA